MTYAGNEVFAHRGWRQRLPPLRVV